jgi:hypothetical protein
MGKCFNIPGVNSGPRTKFIRCQPTLRSSRDINKLNSHGYKVNLILNISESQLKECSMYRLQQELFFKCLRSIYYHMNRNVYFNS